MNEHSIPLPGVDCDDTGLIDKTQHRRIIICCDGTWNDREAKQPLTNVSRIQSCIAVRGQSNGHRYEQVSYYLDGIGAGTTFAGSIHDGSTGRGINRKIREAYRNLCLAYTDEHDEIILVGFSRGAFTVRCLASLVNDVGILGSAYLNTELPKIFRLWESQKISQNGLDRSTEATELENHCQELIARYQRPREQNSNELQTIETVLRRQVKIKACAVWDTVKSLGIPFPRGIPHMRTKKFSFVNYKLSPNIENAFQALALDEMRYHFPPSIWSMSQSGQALKQCWFLGSHSDIGGGYRNCGLANISLLWMITQLRHFVQFDQRAIWHATDVGHILQVNVAKENRANLSRLRGAKPRFDIVRSKSSAWLQSLWRFPRSTVRPNFEASGVQPPPPAIQLYEPSSEGCQSTASMPLGYIWEPVEDFPRPNPPGTKPPPCLEYLDDSLEGGVLGPPPSPPQSIDWNSSVSELNQQVTSAENVLAMGEVDTERYATRPPLVIDDIRTHDPLNIIWKPAGSKTRKVGLYRRPGDDRRTHRGHQPPGDTADDFGSNEMLHFTVRVLIEMQGPNKCRSLQDFDRSYDDIRPVWRYKVPGERDLIIPEDQPDEYEQGMLHRWLDRDLAFREDIGGNAAMEALTGVGPSS